MNLLKQIRYIILFIVIFGYGCNTVNIINVNNTEDIEIKKDGIIYSLPKTVFNIEVEVSRTETKAGPYASYAEKYLGISNVIKKDSVSWQITDVNIFSYAEPDPEQVYYMESCLSAPTQLIQLTKDGLILGINGDCTSHNSENKTNIFLNNDFSETIELNQLPVINAQTEKIDTTYRTITTDSSSTVIPVLKKYQVNKSSEAKAEEIANFILDLREEKVSILIGDLKEYPDGKAMEIIMNEFRTIENQYLPLFTGKNSVQKYKAVFEFIPTNQNLDSKNVLFRFSSKNGILSNKELAGEPVLIHIQNMNNTESLDSFFCQKDTTVKNSNGLIYRLPEQANVKIIEGENVIATKKVSIAQYGKVNVLPSKILKNKNITLKFDPEYGSLISVSRKKHLFSHRSSGSRH